jgi:hypothetical protein
MKITFISEQDGLRVQMNLEAEFIYEIEDAFKDFLRGSGFTVLDEEDIQISDTADSVEISGATDWEAVAASQALTIAMLREKIKELNG